MEPAPSITKRQREVLDHLSEHGAFSREKASFVYGTDANVAEKLAGNGVLNKRYDAKHGAVYWIRGDEEPATGVSVPVGVVVILHVDLMTPLGKKENFFLARAHYDGKGKTFRRLLRDWMTKLKLRPRDLLGGYSGFEMHSPDAAMFSGDHVIIDEET